MRQIIAIGGGGFGREIKNLKIEKYIINQSDKKNPVDLPINLRDGDYLDFLSAGAYTSSYVTAKFNGLPAITEYYI